MTGIPPGAITAAAVEVIPCADIPYRCDGFDPADWPGEVPDFSPFRFLGTAVPGGIPPGCICAYTWAGDGTPRAVRNSPAASCPAGHSERAP